MARPSPSPHPAREPLPPGLSVLGQGRRETARCRGSPAPRGWDAQYLLLCVEPTKTWPQRGWGDTRHGQCRPVLASCPGGIIPDGGRAGVGQAVGRSQQPGQRSKRKQANKNPSPPSLTLSPERRTAARLMMRQQHRSGVPIGDDCPDEPHGEVCPQYIGPLSGYTVWTMPSPSCLFA